MISSSGESELSAPITEAVEDSVSEPAQLDLFIDHQSWVAVDLDGQPVVAGPVLESAAAADFTPPNRVGQIAGCVLDAASWAFVLDADRMVTDQSASLDFDCDLETDLAQVDTIQMLVFGSPQVTVAGSELQLTDGANTLTFEPAT